MKAVTRRKNAPVFNGLCPECGARTERYSRLDCSSYRGYKCRNGHIISVLTRSKEVLSVTIPFNPPVLCQMCGLGPLITEAKIHYETEEGLEKAVRLRCPKGHRFVYRQLVYRRFNLPPKELWEGVDYY